MEEAFRPESLALGPNLSLAQHPGGNLNLSVSSRWVTPGQPARTTTAAVITLLALVGNSLLLHQLRCGVGGCSLCGGNQLRRRRRRMDFFLAHLAVADLYGCGLALLSHLPPAAAAPPEPGAEGGEAEWLSRGAPCRLLRLLQRSGLLAPSHMLVLIALERRRRGLGSGPPRARPPSFQPARGALAALGWLLALLLALPQAFVFRPAPPQLGGRCLSIFAQLPRWHGQAYALYGAVTGFVAPACLLGTTCGHILWALSSSRTKQEEELEEEPEPPPRGLAEGGSARHGAAELPGVASPVPPRLLRLWPVAQCVLPSPPTPRTLPRARARSLQLTLALAALFALCGFPRFFLELGVAFGPRGVTGEEAQATLGSLLAATNAALNPYVCLVFHSHRPWARRLQRSLCCCPDGQPRQRARPRHHPPPQLSAERPARWLCPCQTKELSVSTVVRREAVQTPAAPLACESGF
uniref:Probable G-protein coupled receptor 150 n=1 Tax=Pogona vitticeps TaxID=103695 RepID=A0ABM5FT99_9SAUR